MSADDRTLYVELVQVASARDREMAWVRPLLLVDRDREAKIQLKACTIAQGADILWPYACFEQAYAEDFLPLLSQAIDLEAAKTKLILRAFIRRAWELHWPSQAA